MRVELAIALAQYPTPAVFQALVAALSQRELAVNVAAVDSLRTLTGQTIAIDEDAWLAYYASTSTPFATARVYLYPTFVRELDIWDHLLFWQPVVFEQPDVPVGMKVLGTRRTNDASRENADPATMVDPLADAPQAKSGGLASGLGGLIGSLIQRSTPHRISQDEAGYADMEDLPEAAGLDPGEVDPDHVGPELPDPDLSVGPVLATKGKAVAAPPTDREAINHEVNLRQAAPQPFEGEEAAAPVVPLGEEQPAAAERVPATGGLSAAR